MLFIFFNGGGEQEREKERVEGGMEQSEQTTHPRGGSGLLIPTGMEKSLIC